MGHIHFDLPSYRVTLGTCPGAGKYRLSLTASNGREIFERFTDDPVGWSVIRKRELGYRPGLCLHYGRRCPADVSRQAVALLLFPPRAA